MISILGENDRGVVVARVRDAFEIGLNFYPTQYLEQLYSTCNKAWLEIITDAHDSWQYWPVDHINEMQLLWEERCRLLLQELEQRDDRG